MAIDSSKLIYYFSGTYQSISIILIRIVLNKESSLNIIQNQVKKNTTGHSNLRHYSKKNVFGLITFVQFESISVNVFSNVSALIRTCCIVVRLYFDVELFPIKLSHMK